MAKSTQSNQLEEEFVKAKERYFERIKTIIKNNNEETIQMSRLTNFVNSDGITYKGLFPSFKKSLEEMENEGTIKLSKDTSGLQWMIGLN